jgi:hypothetical protein
MYEPMPTLTIFANFRIDSDERYQRMVDSFHSCAGITASQWVVNARGKHAKKTIQFLRKQLGERLVAFRLESSRGWFYDSRQMLPHITGDFVLFWLEDHLNVVPPETYAQVLLDMKHSHSEYLLYSWFLFGKQLEIFKDVISGEQPTIVTFTHTKDTLRQVEQFHSTYLISMPGLFSKALFTKIISKTPTFLWQFSKFAPFDFEKGAGDTQWLPIATALPKFELFAAIDDESGTPGYSLRSRGLYPIRERRPVAQSIPQKSKIKILLKSIAPRPLYKHLIRIVIIRNKVTNYIRLVRSGN